jgi:outer membrane receptor protein involved in Fe transport
VTDYYLCATQGNNQNCGANYSEEVSGTLLSNKQLQPTTAESWTGGLVWAPVERMSLSADFLHIAIQNEVAPQSADLLMRQDAQCLLGQLPAGSPICTAAYAQVTRSPLTNQVETIAQYYVNISNEVTDSVTAEAKYTFETTPIGVFGLQFDYNDMLKHSYQIYPGSTPINQLTNPLYSSEFKSIGTGALSWSLHDTWSSTVYAHRYSPSPNYTGMVDGAGYPGASRVPAWMTYNWSLTYTPIKGLDLSLLVNNVFNKMPPNDPTYTSFPYYNTENYNVYGREVMMQVDWKFAGAEH